MQNQVYIFIIYILNGFLIGILFDCFRILRRCFKTNDFITQLEDILFGIICGAILLVSGLKFNNGELRLYTFIGIILGITLYMLIFSSVFIKIMVYLILKIKYIFSILFILPVKSICKFIKKRLFKSFFFLCLNIKKYFNKTLFHILGINKKSKIKK